MQTLFSYRFSFSGIKFDEQTLKDARPRLQEVQVACAACDQDWTAANSGPDRFYPNLGNYLFDCPNCRARESIEPEFLVKGIPILSA